MRDRQTVTGTVVRQWDLGSNPFWLTSVVTTFSTVTKTASWLVSLPVFMHKHLIVLVATASVRY